LRGFSDVGMSQEKTINVFLYKQFPKELVVQFTIS